MNLHTVRGSALPGAQQSFILALAFVTFPVVMAARAEVRHPGSDPPRAASPRGWSKTITVPIFITMRFSFSGGSVQEPEGKEGLANLMTGLFDEGAGDLESAAFLGAHGRCRRRR